jgi:hypothetical protein
MRRTILGLAAVALAGVAANASAPKAAMLGKPDIEYETFGCLGQCPVYKIQIWHNGQGVFTGIRDTVITGEGKFSVTEEQYSAFAGTLDRFRPKQDIIYDGRAGGPCAQVATDQASVQVTWRGTNTRKLYYNYGCDREKHAAMASALANAPKMLPVRRMISRTW